MNSKASSNPGCVSDFEKRLGCLTLSYLSDQIITGPRQIPSTLRTVN